MLVFAVDDDSERRMSNELTSAACSHQIDYYRSTFTTSTPGERKFTEKSNHYRDTNFFPASAVVFALSLLFLQLQMEATRCKLKLLASFKRYRAYKLPLTSERHKLRFAVRLELEIWHEENNRHCLFEVIFMISCSEISSETTTMLS
jgi:hypothetical protein